MVKLYVHSETGSIDTQDREAGNYIDEFKTMAEAKKAVERFESIDRIEDTYTPNFYEIVKEEE